MVNTSMRMADLGDRLNWTKMPDSDRRRALMAMSQAEALVDLAQVAFSQVRRLMKCTRSGCGKSARRSVTPVVH
jgi:hypothetical protein